MPDQTTTPDQKTTAGQQAALSQKTATAQPFALNLPSLYNQIAHKVRETGAESLTLDLFDTVLLRKSWPAQLQNLQIAAAWQSSLPELFGQLSPSTILAWRDFAYAELRALHDGNLLTEFQPSLAACFDALVSLVSNFYHLNLSESQHENAIKTMVQDEFSILKLNLSPNHVFLDAITSLKTALPSLKIYFLEDSPYSTAELKDLLAHFDIQIFDGGLSSTDAAVTKHSGRLYQYLQDTDTLTAGNFDLHKNLHIGDSRRSDYRQALRAGSFALHYRPIRFRGLRTVIGKAKTLQTSRQNNTFPDKDHLRALHHTFFAAHHPEARFLIPAELMSQFQDLETPANLQITPQLSHAAACKAMVWLLANRHDQSWNAHAIAQTIVTYLNDSSRFAIYNFCFENDFPTSEFLLNHRTNDEFCAALLNDLVTSDVTHTTSLRQSYIELAELLSLAQEGITIVEASRQHPIQTLFTEFAKLHGVTTPVQVQTF